MPIEIDQGLLEKACREIIETILFCLPNAYKGTVYRIGKPPELISTRITSGIIDPERKSISWGLPEKSDYNSPGKPWLAFRDEPGRPLEAMAWCVEHQRSWTAEDPRNDIRSVRLQVAGIWEDFHHMEPVLIRKEDLFLSNVLPLDFPKTYDGRTLWDDSEYVVAGVIKIHFRPYTILINSAETKLIKRLSKALGTELLSYQLRQQSLEAIQKLAEDRLNSCNILADSLRNAITKSGLIFSLIKLEMGFLRDQWESVIVQDIQQKDMKRQTVEALNQAAQALPEELGQQGQDLMVAQNRFLHLYLLPERGENWVRMQIEQKWNDIFSRQVMEAVKVLEIRGWIEQLKRSLYLGKDPEVLSNYLQMSESMKQEWIDLFYRAEESVDLGVVDRIIRLLEQPSLSLPFRDKSRKTLIRLKAVAVIIRQLEEDTNKVLRGVLNGAGGACLPNGVSLYKG